MSFGAFILLQKTKSAGFEYLSSDHECAITEIRVEQHLNKQTTFAVRFQEDFEDEKQVKEVQALFAKSLGIAICAADGARPSLTAMIPPGLVCLVRGQIEKVEFNVNVGGSGSWFEIRGQDNRTEINRSVEIITAEGSTKEIIEALVGVFADEADVGDGIKNYVENSYTFRGSALEAVYDLARKSSYNFWLDHELQLGVGSLSRTESPFFDVKTTAHVKPSPPRTEQLSEPPEAFAGFELVASKNTPKLRILGDEGECETVVSFSSHVDNEVYRSATSSGQDLGSGEAQHTEDAGPQDDDLNENRENSNTVGGEQGPALDLDVPGIHKVLIGPDPEDDIAPWRAFAAATEASWYVKGEALTTVHMLQHVLAPHDFVEVIGGGCGIAGIYQVSDVTHVINAAEHWMELKLRSNSRSLKQHPNLP